MIMAKSMTNVSNNLAIVFLITSVLIFDTLVVLCSGNDSHVLCLESERQALLRLKQDLIFDPSNRLLSWGSGGGDCCEWVGVVCNNLTGNVEELRLRNPFNDLRNSVGGKLNPSLLDLKHLTYLDLSSNYFYWIQIPSFIGSLGSLRYLNLSYGGFGGVIPTQLGNLSSLNSLDLAGDFHGVIPHQLGNLSNLHYLRLESSGYLYAENLYAETLQWLSGNSLLQHLDLYVVNLSKASDWLEAVNMLPYLVELRLSLCNLHPFPLLHRVNFTSLAFLDLSHNHFDSFIPDWLLSLSNLNHLDLKSSTFRGPIPSGLQNMTFLRYIDFSLNFFNSIIPEWLSSFSSLEYLDLSVNKFTGMLPRSFGNLCNLKRVLLSGFNIGSHILEVLDTFSRCILDELEGLDLSRNQLSGHFPDIVNRLEKSKKLVYLDLSRNSFSGHVPLSLGRLSSLKYLYLLKNNLSVSPNWVPQFQLEELSFGSSHLGPQFPQWLQSQTKLRALDISNTGISGTIPRWFWNLASQIGHLNLSHNHIHGDLVNKLLVFEPYTTIDLSFNHFNGTLPRVSPNVSTLDLSNNLFSGSISHFLCYKMDETKFLELLNLERNLLSGELPNCWTSWSILQFINLRNNNLSGKIPRSMGSLNFLQSLHLRKNNFSGELPLLQNCTKLVSLDFGENQFAGSIPTWIGERLPYLNILVLRSNKFHNHIPKELCALNSLRILDLAQNNFLGIIPACFMNLSAMVVQQNSSDQMLYWPGFYFQFFFEGFLENEILVMKRKFSGYSTILQLVTSMDLSDNNLSGEIPRELMSLRGLQSLNLSCNNLTGMIPENIGVMGLLESIDFSMNFLSGGIPPSMSSLTFLSHLNLSYNNLTGKIPSGTQLQSFNTLSFLRNSVCGPPVSDNCSGNDVRPTIENGGRKKGNGITMDWFYVSMALGFVVGFWVIVGPFLFNEAWRFVCFRFMDNMWYKFCDFICMC